MFDDGNARPRSGSLPAGPLRLLSLVLAALIICVCPLSSASPHRAAGDVHVVVSQAASYYEQVANALRDYVRNRHPEIVVRFHTAERLAGLRPGENSLFICIGTPASIQIADRFPRHRQLNLFITRQVWERLSGDTPKARKAFLFVDQPIARQFALARVLAPEAGIFAAVTGPASADQQPLAEDAARAVGAELHSATLSAESNPLAVLTPLLEDADVFVPVPDSALINRNVAKWALYLAFRHKIPVIGFSQAYTDAGAAASIFTSPDDISRQAIGWLEQYFSNPAFDGWHTYPPAYFTISVNDSVVRSLGLDRPDNLVERVAQQLRDTPP